MTGGKPLQVLEDVSGAVWRIFVVLGLLRAKGATAPVASSGGWIRKYPSGRKVLIEGEIIERERRPVIAGQLNAEHGKQGLLSGSGNDIVDKTRKWVLP